MIGRLCFLLLTMVWSVSLSASVADDNDALVDSISYYVGRYKETISHRSEIADSMKSIRGSMAPGEQRIRMGEALGRRYLTQSLDSALIYWTLAEREAHDLGNEELAMMLRLDILSSMPLRGVAIEALREFEQIDTTGFSPQMKKHYWLNRSEIYYNIQRPYPDGDARNHYRAKALEALDSLSRYYPAESPVSGFISSYIHKLRGENNLAVASFAEALPSLIKRPVLYDVAISNLVEYYRNRPEHRDQYLSYLYRQALNQLRTGEIRSQVIAEAGEALAAEGHHNLGTRLIIKAMHKGESGLGPYVNFDQSEYISIIHRTAIKQQIAIAILLALLIAAIIFIYIKLRKYKTALATLLTDTGKEEERHKAELDDMHKVCSNLLSMALFSDEQLKEYNIYVLRKLKAGQAKDLYHDVQSGEYVQSMSDKFFGMFDKTFLDSFPGFVDKLNALLQPDRGLSMLPGDKMSPELRIAAFMRLGVNDSSKLSQVLGLSVNTIYTYRNRLKSRAINRVTFEADLQRISIGEPTD